MLERQRGLVRRGKLLGLFLRLRRRKFPVRAELFLGAVAAVVVLQMYQLTVNVDTVFSLERSSLWKPPATTDSVGCCLLVMNDNHKLVEWMAYNWYTLPMRHLIVATDPANTQSIDNIMSRWEDRVEITRWTDEDYFIPENATSTAETLPPTERHRARQTTLFAKCLRTFKQKGLGWVLLTDNDEYVYINPRAEQHFSGLYRPNIPPISQQGSILAFLAQEQLQDRLRRPCLTMARYQFNSIESSSAKISSGVPDFFDARDFATMRWRHYAKLCSFGKNLVNVAALSYDQIPSDKTPTVHTTLPNMCPRTSTWFTNDRNSILMVNHYLGTWEQYVRKNDTREQDRPRARRTFDRLKTQNRGIQDNIRPWLQGFVNTVGDQEAKRLLHGCGTVGYEGW